MANPLTGCTCGSGGHPRHCALHPHAFAVHVAELNLEAVFSDVEDEALRERLYKAWDEYLAAEKLDRA